MKVPFGFGLATVCVKEDPPALATRVRRMQSPGAVSSTREELVRVRKQLESDFVAGVVGDAVAEGSMKGNRNLVCTRRKHCV